MYIISQRLLTFPNLIFRFWFVLELIEVEEGLRMGSTAGIPIRDNRSASMADFSLTSNGLSQLREGDKLTSSNQGFKFSSIRMSKP